MMILRSSSLSLPADGGFAPQQIDDSPKKYFCKKKYSTVSVRSFYCARTVNAVLLLRAHLLSAQVRSARVRILIPINGFKGNSGFQ